MSRFLLSGGFVWLGLWIYSIIASMKMSLYSIILMVLLLTSLSLAEMNLSTPLETLATYISAMRSGNKQLVLRCYKTDNFYLPYPIPIDEYRIVNKTTYTKEMSEKYMAIPKAQEGDVELDVVEIINGKQDTYTYLFRRFHDEWYIISHYAWSMTDT